MGLAVVAALALAPGPLSAEELGGINPAVEGGGFNPAVEQPDAPRPRAATPAGPHKRIELDLYSGTLEERVARVLKVMTTQEKIGQLCQVAAFGTDLPDAVRQDIRDGWVGSLFYTGSPAQTYEAQQVAMKESRLGLPLLAPRDVIHGFRTIFPIPLGQAATWNPELAERGAEVAAREARMVGVNWTFAPMVDIARDARWGRIAESLGEDPVLASAFSRAMVRGYQGLERDPDGTTRCTGVAACAKHFVAYGLSEGGRDYNRSEIGVGELHDIFLAPFRAAADEGCLTFMSGFNTVNGIPATGNRELLRDVLKKRWGFEGLVVSDWSSVVELIDHGYAADRQHAALRAFTAGVDMEMATSTYREHLQEHLEKGRISAEQLDDAVARVLRVKLLAALPPKGKEVPKPADEALMTSQTKELALQMARQGVVLLKNERALLPLKAKRLKRVAVLGPLADSGRDQLGCWMLDGKPEEAQTLAKALADSLQGGAELQVVAGMASSIDPKGEGIAEAVAAAASADVAVVCIGESAESSGEARSRATLGLPGAQCELVRRVAQTGTPVVLVVFAGRPLTLCEETRQADAVLYAWHPGTMGGPAIADLLLGVESPSGKLPVTLPRLVGQLPMYYNHPSTGRPPLVGTRALWGSGATDFPEPQKYRSHYLDVDPTPAYPFGFGLSYTSFRYGEPELTLDVLEPGQTLGVRVELTNTGNLEAEEVAQLYVQDVTASLVRPVRELKAFRRVRLKPGESTLLEFALSSDDLAFHDNQAETVVESGRYRLGVGGDSTAPLVARFRLRAPERFDGQETAQSRLGRH